MRGFINLSIGIKLLISFILIAFIAGIVGTNGIIELKKVRHEYSELFSSYGNGQGYMAQVYTGFLKQRLAIRDIFIFTDKKSREAKFSKIAAMDLVIKKGLEDYVKTCILKEDFNQAKILKECLTDYRKRLRDIEDLLNQKEEKRAYILFNDSLGSGAKVDEQMDKILTFNMSEGQKISSDLDTSVKRTEYLLIFFVISAMVLDIFIGLFITSTINSPIKKNNSNF